MTLTFTTAEGQTLGDVQLVDGELVGKAPLVEVVRSTMRRTGTDAGAALQALDGWSNGYLRARLTP